MKKKYPVICAVLLILPCIAFQGCLKPEAAERAVTRLVGDLDSPDPEVRKHAADQLRERDELGVQKEAAISALRKHLNDEDVYVRWAAGNTLIAIDSGGNRELVLSSLLKEIEDPKAEIREFAALRLGSFESESNPRRATESDFNIEPNNIIVTALLKHLNDGEVTVRYAAAVGLGSIDAPRFRKIIMPILIEILNSRAKFKRDHQIDAIDICWQFGPAMKNAVPALTNLMNEKNQDEDIKQLCKDALKRIGTPDALMAIRPLEQAQETLRLKITAFSCALIAFFVLLFGWSVKLRRKGRKVFHWFIPITIALLAVMTYSSQTGTVDMDFIRAEYVFWLFSSFIGFIPWLTSWFILRRRGSLEAAISSGGESHDADLWLRAGAFMLDGCCMGMPELIFLAHFFMKGGWRYLYDHILILALLIFAVSVIYHAVTAIVWDGGIGKRTAGIRIVSVDGQGINYKQAFVRALARWLSALPLFAGYWPAFSGKAAWHDRLAGTRVVYDEQTTKAANNPPAPTD